MMVAHWIVLCDVRSSSDCVENTTPDMGSSPRSALREEAKITGWVRRKINGRMCDVCEPCAAARSKP